jgi:NADPH:quinone reductase-like Zn-dependent oxidoreductase
MEQQVAEALGEDRLALVIDALGGDPLRVLAHHLRFGGYAVNYAFLSAEPLVSVLDLLFNEVHHTGFWLGTWVRDADRAEVLDTYTRLAEHVANGELSVPIEATYPLQQYRRAFEHAKARGRSGKVLFTF